MKTTRMIRWIACLAASTQAWAGLTDLATAPLVTSSGSSVQPNIMYVLDDSLSMGDDYLPDWALSYSNTDSKNLNSSFNGVAYNPAITYTPPIYYNADGSLNTTAYPAQNVANTSSWTRVKNDGYGKQSTTTSNLVNNAYFYTTVPGEYCDKPNLVNCNAQSAPSSAYPYPAYLRWCDNASHCQAIWTNGNTWGSSAFQNPRMPSQYTATLNLGGSSPTSTSVSSIKVNGAEILSATTTAATGTTLAGYIAANVNNCTYSLSGNCAVVGYSASSSGSVVTIFSPAQQTYTPTVTKGNAGTVTIAASAFGPPPYAAMLSVGGSGSTSVAGIQVNSAQIMSGSSTASNNASTVATNIAARINACTGGLTGNCTVAGYSASASGSVVTIYSPAPQTYTPVVTTASGSMAFTASAFGPQPGVLLFTSITSSVTSYPYPGTAAKAASRSDCAGATCTYTEEMTNYANWWAYYRTRMQMTKTSISQAFSSIGPTFRVGYMTINNGTGSDFINAQQFTPANKLAWYNKLFAAVPNNTTPLRAALAKIGRYYANKAGSSINGVSTTDPMQYSCQQNFTIVSTDGYWNETTNPVQLNGSTAIGQQDGSEPRPFNDGAATTTTVVTPYTTVIRKQTVTSNATQTTPWTRTVTTVSGANNCTPSGSNKKNGYTVTVTPQTYNQVAKVATGATLTSVDDYTYTYSESIATTNGIPAPAVDTPAAPGSLTSTSNVSSDPFVTASDTGAPSGSTTWTSGTATSSCTTSPPAASASTPVAGTPAMTGTSTVTTLNTTGPTAGAATTTTAVSSVGTSNTLADVAEYYYVTDLRTSTLGNCTGAVVPPATTGNDVCSNDVPQSGQDSASWQHMTTFTLGLGASGYMQFSPSYAAATSGDYYDVKNGTSANPSGGVCTWQANSTACNWPVPVSNDQTTIDDLWHAAVNGRGSYYSATNPASLATGLGNALAGVSARVGASAAATTSNPNVTSGDNFVFSSTFTTVEWDGQLFRQQIDLTTGAVPTFDINNPSTYDWAAQGLLDGNMSRAIYTYDASASAAASKLKLLTWGNLTPTEQGYFNAANIASLSQFCSAGITCLSPASQASAAGANLLAFITGDRGNEGAATDISTYYRQRTHLLGDIVDAEAVYVKASLFAYADAGYSDFAAANTSRQGMVYVAANDGMLHAFNSSTGMETWAYVSLLVLPNLYKLADKNYASLHQFYVDGTPVAGDICPNAPGSSCSAAQWKTILVGGLNAGGRGYYALDVTNPASPKALWEFADANMGYTFGNPIITKLVDGTWVVLVTSGYNNVAPGDGVGRLYVLNAYTGALIRTISTGAGGTTAPSGLARINAWVDNAMSNNTALRIYGGDLLGNLWRFDINNNVGASGYEAERLVTFYSDVAGANAQPITTKPELGDVNGNAVVFVGTGRYLGASDLTDTSLQSFYAVKDRLGNAALTPFSNPRASGSGFINQALTSGTCPPGSPSSICSTGESVRVSTGNAVNFASDNGWYLDLPDSGERSDSDPTLALGTLGFTTNVPNISACTAGGYSYSYFLDYRTGAPVSTSTTSVVGVKLGNALATRMVFVRLPNNTVVALVRMSDGSTLTENVPIGSGSGTTRRVSWRELVNE